MTLTVEQLYERNLDPGRDVGALTKVEEHDESFSLSAGSSGFGLSKKYGVVPTVGQRVTLYTHNWSTIHGLDLDGQPVFYKTKAEQDAEHEEWKRNWEQEKRDRFDLDRRRLDAAFAALPAVFQRRIQWFRDHNDAFRWEDEAYELTCCTDAVLIAEWARGREGDTIHDLHEMPWKKQKQAIPDLDDGHSGNTFGCACRLARLYLQDPLLVIAEHGALTPLVGCDEYGCAHPRDADVLAAVEAAASPGGVRD